MHMDPLLKMKLFYEDIWIWSILSATPASKVRLSEKQAGLVKNKMSFLRGLRLSPEKKLGWELGTRLESAARDSIEVWVGSPALTG